MTVPATCPATPTPPPPQPAPAPRPRVVRCVMVEYAALTDPAGALHRDAPHVLTALVEMRLAVVLCSPAQPLDPTAALPAIFLGIHKRGQLTPLRPTPAYFAAARAATGYEPTETMYATSVPEHAARARGTGMATALITGTHPRPDVMPADVTVLGLHQLPELLAPRLPWAMP
jgi:hypothetical protein